MKLLLTALIALCVSMSGCAAELDLTDEEQGLASCPLPPGSFRSYPIAGGSGGYVWVNIWYEHCVDDGWDGTFLAKWVQVIRPDGTIAESDIYVDDCRSCGVPASE